MKLMKIMRILIYIYYKFTCSEAVKSYDRSLCDKSTKFGVVILYFMHFHFRMGTIKNYNGKPTIINIFEKL